jgi:hypothetical protein
MPATSLALALDLVLHGPPPSTGQTPSAPVANQEIILLDYRDPATFSALWLHGLESSKVTIGDQPEIYLTDSTKQFLLIGNDPPDGIFDTKIPALSGINFRSHFTATSWLAAWKVKWEGELTAEAEKAQRNLEAANTAEEGKTQRGEENKLPRIAVIDPRPAGSAQGVALALQTILSARDANGHPLVRRATVLNAPSLEAICQWLAEESVSRQARQDRQGNESEPSRPPRPLRETSESILSLLKSTIWNELTSDREQHHALSNVLGSFLLSSQVGKGQGHSGGAWIQDYLLALVRVLGVDADLDQVRLKEHQGSQRWITPVQQQAIGGAFLIDDMASLWEYFLRGATGFIGDSTLGDTGRSYRDSFAICGGKEVDSGIAGIPERLSVFFETRKAYLNAEVLAGCPSRLVEDFVLFLDLRLFRSTATGQATEAERAFYHGLASFGLRLLDSRRSLPWIDDEEREALRNELRQASNSAATGLAPPETLLPRILSLLDPTLPIVIFSSTHRTEFIEPFRNFGNIITNFHKPVLTSLAGDWEASVCEMHTAFIDAVDRAAAILRIRSLLRPFQKPLLLN